MSARGFISTISHILFFLPSYFFIPHRRTVRKCIQIDLFTEKNPSQGLSNFKKSFCPHFSKCSKSISFFAVFSQSRTFYEKSIQKSYFLKKKNFPSTHRWYFNKNSALIRVVLRKYRICPDLFTR